MTVYGLSVHDFLGPDYTYGDMARVQELIDEEIAEAEVDDTVYICEEWDKFTYLPFPLEERRPDIAGALEQAYNRFMQEMSSQP